MIRPRIYTYHQCYFCSRRVACRIPNCEQRADRMICPRCIDTVLGKLPEGENDGILGESDNSPKIRKIKS